jgi:hypothetical protein
MTNELLTPQGGGISGAALASEAVLRALRSSARPDERPEELLLDLGLLSERDLALELARASSLTYCGLRGFSPDPRLFLYLPLHVALRERLCPLVLVGDSMKLATAFVDPDLTYLTRRFPKLELELVVATRGEILGALEHVAPRA